MADYKWRVSGSVLCSGSDWLPPEVYPTIDWQDRNTVTGSQETQAVIRNSDSAGYQRQRVDVNVANSWSVRWDKNNFMYVDLTCNLNSISGSIYQSGRANYVGRHIVIRNYDGGSILVNMDYSANATGLIRGSTSLGTWTLGPISPKTESSKNSFYLANWSVGYATEADCNIYTEKYTAGVQFYNNRNLEYDTPTISSTSCTPYNNGGQFSATADFGDYRKSASVKFQISDKSDFSNIVYETTKSGNNNKTQTISMTKTGLQPNTRYYVRYQANNGAKTSSWSTCNFVTLVTNTLSNQKATAWNNGTVRLAVQMGGGVYTNPQTKIYIKRCGTDAWTEKATRTTKTVADVEITGLEANTCYEIQARTTTTAGTYTGNTVSFTTPQRNIATAYFKTVDLEYDENENAAVAHICYKYESSAVPVDVTIYYRVKNGFDPTWLKSETVTFNQLTGEYCLDLHNLIPNQTVYEMYLKTTLQGNDWQGTITEFVTPIQPIPNNCTCANMQYLVDLICQAVKPLYKGNKTIYANPTTKELCDPYSKNPTFATLWSRLLRFDHAAACVMCDMLDIMKLKGGKANQYYAGETGWVDLATEIVEGAVEIPSSKTVKDYIAEKIHEVWHFHSSVEYLAGVKSEFPTTGLTSGMEAIEASTSHLYRWNGSSWRQVSSFSVDNFAVFHIEKALNSSFGNVKANSAYYYFEGTWNNLDADTRDLERRADFLERALVVDKQNPSEDDIQVQTNEADFEYDSLPEGKRVVCFVVEDPSSPKVYYPVVYYYYKGGAKYLTRQVESGRKATRPADPTRIGYTFNKWANEDGTDFNFNQNITEPKKVYGTWTAVNYRVTFNSNGGVPATIPAQTIPYGGTITDPGVTKTGYNFDGWYDGTDLVDISTPITKNMNLVAAWIAKKIVVSFDPRLDDGSGTFEEETSYGGTVPVPTQPVKTGYSFGGWKELDSDLPFNFNEPLYENKTVYAVWEEITFTITFNSDGGTAVPTKVVRYGELCPVPTPPPTKENFAFAGWFDENDVRYDFSVPVTANANLKAHWESAYVITFNPNGGTPVPETQYVLPGSTVTEPETISKTGYDFNYWENNGTEWHFSSDTPTGDTTLDANFTIKVFTVSFNTGTAGSLVPTPDSQSVEYNSSAVNPWQAPVQFLNPEDDHYYVSAGWTLNGADYDFTTPVTADIELVAKWSVRAKITFDPNGGTLTDSPRQDVPQGGKITQPTDPAYSGELFNNWYENNVGGLYQGEVEDEES